MNKRLSTPFALCLCFIFSFSAHAAVTLPKIFSSHMIVQRDAPIRIWGWAEKGERIRILFKGHELSTTANSKGNWFVEFPGGEAGGPYEVIIKGDNVITLSDIWLGDVWVCSGQSNMQWYVNQTGYQEKDTAFIQSAVVRLFTVPVDMDYVAREDLAGGEWKTLTSENIEWFSAVAYHFGKFLHERLDIPIGLVSANLGATSIETWMSNESLSQFPQFTDLVSPLVKQGKNFATLKSEFEQTKNKWYAKCYYKGIGIDQHWYEPSTHIGDWKTIELSGNTWENEPDLKDHDGEVWFRTTFDLPENYQGEQYQINLNQIDDHDIAWVNGVKVGETFGRHNHRTYWVPAKSLKKKGNVLVIRVFDSGGIGGFTTSRFWGNPILLGKWYYKKGSSIEHGKFSDPNLPNATPFSSPGVLYNGMIAPLIRISIKGVIWYQGESNVDRAEEYRSLLATMITDWRNRWKLGDFPFLFVQLANHYDESAIPQESTWAELREAQMMTLRLANTGMATAIDIGEASDIHPKNKQEVGRRLGLSALKVAYNKDVVHRGPTFNRMEIKGNEIVIQFNNTGKGLVTKDKYGYVRGFQVAGEDRKFHWARACIIENKVIVTCPQVNRPLAVRYAWSDNPGQLDLYNSEGLPAIPFRTDSWEGITAGKVFVDGPRF